MQQALVLHHLKIEELPAEWAARLPAGQTFTITITPERARQVKSAEQASPPPLFGIWRDKPDAQDVDAYVRRVRFLFVRIRIHRILGLSGWRHSTHPANPDSDIGEVGV